MQLVHCKIYVRLPLKILFSTDRFSCWSLPRHEGLQAQVWENQILIKSRVARSSCVIQSRSLTPSRAALLPGPGKEPAGSPPVHHMAHGGQHPRLTGTGESLPPYAAALHNSTRP